MQGGYFIKRDIKDGQAKDKAEEKKPSHEVPVPEKKDLEGNKGAYCLDGQYNYDFFEGIKESTVFRPCFLFYL